MSGYNPLLTAAPCSPVLPYAPLPANSSRTPHPPRLVWAFLPLLLTIVWISLSCFALYRDGRSFNRGDHWARIFFHTLIGGTLLLLVLAPVNAWLAYAWKHVPHRRRIIAVIPILLSLIVPWSSVALPRYAFDYGRARAYAALNFPALATDARWLSAQIPADAPGPLLWQLSATGNERQYIPDHPIACGPAIDAVRHDTLAATHQAVLCKLDAGQGIVIFTSPISDPKSFAAQHHLQLLDAPTQSFRFNASDWQNISLFVE